ncbi:hypothetical protein T02_4746 [Trichinella nativa]|uniref:Uncharacterized protein n=1 Tax=Trichinella nativa TaxID=6335 RepID=A0A0V1L7U4_9BILA|nr:hypothetical protein T02_4746 [Trichinella nativa]
MRANRKHHSDSQWDIGRFNSHIIKKYSPTAEFSDEVVQKVIRLVDVVETLMLFQERDVLNYVITTMCCGDAQLLNNQVIQYEFSCVLVPVIPMVVITDLNNSASVS